MTKLDPEMRRELVQFNHDRRISLGLIYEPRVLSGEFLIDTLPVGPEAISVGLDQFEEGGDQALFDWIDLMCPYDWRSGVRPTRTPGGGQMLYECWNLRLRGFGPYELHTATGAALDSLGELMGQARGDSDDSTYRGDSLTALNERHTKSSNTGSG